MTPDRPDLWEDHSADPEGLAPRTDTPSTGEPYGRSMGERPADRADIEAAWDELVDDLRHATFDTRTAEQLLRVKATCVLRVAGHDHLQCTLRFDAKPPEVEDGPAPSEAEIEVTLPPDVVPRFWTTALSLAIMREGATFRGPVRRLLSVYPILRAQAEARRAPQTSHLGAA
jgi:hypothetical protein